MSNPVFEMARAIAPHGTLRRHVPHEPKWRRTIGGDIISLTLMSRRPAPWQLAQLEDTYSLAEGIADMRQAEAWRAATAARPCRKAAVLYVRDPVARRWRRHRVPIALLALTVRPEGSV
jgi:hypothetical protein